MTDRRGEQRPGETPRATPRETPQETPRETLHVDCDSCAARGLACGDCVISVLLGAPDTGVDLDTSDQDALAALAESGLVPPLRLIPGARPVESVQSRLEWPEFG